MANTRFNCI